MERWTSYYLTIREQKNKVYEFYAVGHGDFPFDMLRTDACFPCGPEDAAQLAPNDLGTLEGHRRLRNIKLRSYQQPTPERWSSFVWSIGKDRV